MRLGDAYRPLREVVAEQLRSMILSGELVAGERLLEDKLAELLGVSRNPVREAIRMLESTGLVEVQPRRGAYVCQPDLGELRKLLELRGVLEGHAAETVAATRPPELVEQLRACVDAGEEATAGGNSMRAAELHLEFHHAIEEAAGNPYLVQAIEPVRQRTELVFSMLLDDRHDGWDEHRAILEAIASGDGERAREAVRSHLTSVVDDLDRHEVHRATR
jgi:DNA-binding GntR family transcriptional regulator